MVSAVLRGIRIFCARTSCDVSHRGHVLLQAMEVMSREFRKQTEKEIEMIQDAIFAEDDDIHFRRMDAERLMKELRLASYKADIK